MDVVLRSAHHPHSGGSRRRDFTRRAIDLPVLQSHLLDFEDLLVHDGCTGVVVVSSALPSERPTPWRLTGYACRAA